MDGGYHNGTEQALKDAERDEYLSGLGFRIIRLTNDEVLRDLFNALQKIKEATTA